VPLILWSAFVIVSHWGAPLAALGPVAAPAAQALKAAGVADSPSALFAAFYMLFYLYLGVSQNLLSLGVLAASLVGALFLGANAFVAQAGAALAPYGLTPLTGAVALHVVAWVAQFVGHGVFEKRAPALLNSLHQALLDAPIFVVIEVLVKLGFLKEFHKRVSVMVEKERAAWKAGAAGPAGAAPRSNSRSASGKAKSK
jgi:uncharacterized membrane protein YGL010W